MTMSNSFASVGSRCSPRGWHRIRCSGTPRLAARCAGCLHRHELDAAVGKSSFQLARPAARLIVNEVRGVIRVVYDLTSKPPGTIEWEW